MKNTPFAKTVARRNAREDKLWRKYRHRPADELFNRLAPGRIDAVAQRNMGKELDRIRTLRGN